ncbi:MAG: hypothetical protein FD163_2098 [Hyphomonadaceae bacterium]|nr:MAG: hypothetical protein FD128_684 [Hyphomonadaceae bacterium]KAF0183904.1 MAG: hypothetical protein FD163_2098 [Hyphomonadaceae bacterium]
MASAKWLLEFDKKALKQAKQIDKKIMSRIRDYMETRVKTLENPRELGKQMMCEFSDYWRYRVGDYRIICKIANETITIVVVKIGHRRDVYV